MEWHNTICEVYYSTNGNRLIVSGYSNGKYFIYKSNDLWYVYDKEALMLVETAKTFSEAKIIAQKARGKTMEKTKSACYDLIRQYEESLSKNEKSKGVHYTPPELAASMVKTSLGRYYPVPTSIFANHRYPSICDPACGAGVFLIESVIQTADIIYDMDHIYNDRGKYAFYHDDPVIILDQLDGSCDPEDSGRNLYCPCLVRYLNSDEEITEWVNGWDVTISDNSKHVRDEEELLSIRRDVAINCILGIDIDPNAVSVARQALGLLTRLDPREFEHSIIVGDFLVDKTLKCDIYIGNPPFLGGRKISSVYGNEYAKKLKEVYENSKGTTDLCAYFFQQAGRKGAKIINFIATNTISQGGTRHTGLKWLVNNGYRIFKADRNMKWPGNANVTISIVGLERTIG